MQRMVVTLSETQEDSSQEAPHSTGDLSAPAPSQRHRRDSPNTTSGTQPMTEKVRWPQANNNTAWSQLDGDLERVLEATLAGTAEKKIDSMTTIIITMARERSEERKGSSGTKVNQPNRRAREILQLRREIKTPNKQFRTASAEERKGIKDLTSGLRGQLCRLRRAERSLKLRKEKEAKRAQFIKDPYRFTKSLLGEARSGRLTSPKEVVEEFLKESQACGAHPKISRLLKLRRKSLIPENQLGEKSRTLYRKPVQHLPQDQAVYLIKYTGDARCSSAGYGNCCEGYGQKVSFQHPGKEQRGVLYPRKWTPPTSVSSEQFLSNARYCFLSWQKG